MLALDYHNVERHISRLQQSATSLFLRSSEQVGRNTHMPKCCLNTIQGYHTPWLSHDATRGLQKPDLHYISKHGTLANFQPYLTYFM